MNPLIPNLTDRSTDSLSPLPASLRHGLIAITIFACLSYALAAALWIYLTYKLISWRLNLRSRARIVARNIPDPPAIPNLDFDDGAFGPQGQSTNAVHQRNLRQIRNVRHEAPNQFLILIYNLFLADMHQSSAFLLSANWLRHDGILIDKPTCFIQGYFDSNGDLSSSCFITFIAIHTYLSVVRGYQPRQTVLYIAIGLIWLFVYSMSTIPLIATRNGRDVGGYFVRAGPWCWVNEEYSQLRLFTHYLFIFMALIATSSFYVAIFFSLRQQLNLKGVPSIQLSRKHAFLIYAVIYVLCTLPLAIGRILTMARVHVSLGYYCFAGTMIASNGLFDCLIFGTTRHSIVFGSTQDVQESRTGLDTFSFMRTPVRDFGHEVWVQGGTGESRHDRPQSIGGWWPSLGKGHTKGSSSTQKPARSLSQESLRADDTNDMAIHMDVVTSMTIEDRGRRDMRFADPSSSENPSIKSVEGEFRC